MKQFLSWQMGPLRDPDPGATGGGAPGSGHEEPPSFDANRFRSEIMAEVAKQVNGGMSRLEKQIAKLAGGSGSGGSGQPPASGGESGGDGGGTGGDPGRKQTAEDRANARRLQALEEQLASEKKAREESEKRQRETARTSKLQAALAKAGVDPAKITAAERIFGPDVTVNEDGEVVGPNDIPVGEWLQDAVKGYDYLMPARPVGGSGATQPGRKAEAAASLDDIKPGMSAEQRAKVLAAITAAGGR